VDVVVSVWFDAQCAVVESKMRHNITFHADSNGVVTSIDIKFPRTFQGCTKSKRNVPSSFKSEAVLKLMLEVDDIPANAVGGMPYPGQRNAKPVSSKTGAGGGKEEAEQPSFLRKYVSCLVCCGSARAMRGVDVVLLVTMQGLYVGIAVVVLMLGGGGGGPEAAGQRGGGAARR
jgi:hypothetical protein